MARVILDVLVALGIVKKVLLTDYFQTIDKFYVE